MSIRSSNVVGICDSGIGGLTVLSKLMLKYPKVEFIYFADTLRFPYGNKNSNEIKSYIYSIILWFIKYGVQSIVLACNTSSTVALNFARKISLIPVLGVLDEISNAICSETKNLGIIATQLTVNSLVYQNIIAKSHPNIQVHLNACPKLVEIIEYQNTNEKYIKQIIKFYLKPLLAQNIDTLIYGCTHYPFLHNIITQLVPVNIEIIDPANYITLNLVNNNIIKHNKIKFYVTGNPESFAKNLFFYMGFKQQVEQVILS